MPNRFSMDGPGTSRPGQDDQGDQGDERMLSGDTATVQLDSGETVDIPIGYLEVAQEVVQTPDPPPGPEPSPGDDEDEVMEGTTRPKRLREHRQVAKNEATWYHAMKSNNQELAAQMHRFMEECIEFMDPIPDEGSRNE